MLRIKDKNFLYEGDKVKIVSWANGSDSEVQAMIEAAHRGEIKLTNYWSIGETRTITISQFQNASGVTVTTQPVELTLVHKPTSSAFYGGGEFIIQSKNCLLQPDYMNRRNMNAGSFEGSELAMNLNNSTTGFLSSIPSYLQNCLLDAQVITGVFDNTSTGGTNIISTHKVFLPAEKEIFGSNTYSTSNEANALEQWTYYKTSANRIKMNIDNSACSWWERSIYYNDTSDYCSVLTDGTESTDPPSVSLGVAPCMLI